MEVKIGVQHAARELTLESSQTADEVEKAVGEALASDVGLLALQDENGRRIVIPAERLAYVEIGEESTRRVGFGTL